MVSNDDSSLPRSIQDSEIGDGTDIAPFSAVHDCSIGADCTIWRFVNLYGATIGDECMIGSFVEVQPNVEIGDRCRIQSHAFICSLVTIADNVFVSHGAKFINDPYPPAGDEDNWEPTTIESGVSIGTNATLLPVKVGKGAIVGAGAVVVEDVPADAIVIGNPAEVIGYRNNG
jgi:acetyltransferase-like isoleucine patch superfamily enzyme